MAGGRSPVVVLVVLVVLLVAVIVRLTSWSPRRSLVIAGDG
ncbi:MULTISPECIES: hypothetical protein [unclassified Streptomyces]|nr:MULTISPECIES: hypothetical protein [unclassified Streptomyces]